MNEMKLLNKLIKTDPHGSSIWSELTDIHVMQGMVYNFDKLVELSSGQLAFFISTAILHLSF